MTLAFFHERWRQKVSLLAAGALQAAEMPAVEAHVAGCAGCRADLEESRALFATLLDDPVRLAQPPLAVSALRARVEARLDETSAPVFGAAVPRLLWAGVAAALVVALVAAMALRGTAPAAVGPDVAAGQVPTPPALADSAPAVSDQALTRMERTVAREQAARYLGEAQDVLVTVTAAPRKCQRGEARVDVADEARRSRDLLARRATLDLDVAAADSAGPVLDDVERALREVASLEGCARRGTLLALHKDMERRRLLMKMDLMARELEG